VLLTSLTIKPTIYLLATPYTHGDAKKTLPVNKIPLHSTG